MCFTIYDFTPCEGIRNPAFFFTLTSRIQGVDGFNCMESGNQALQSGIHELHWVQNPVHWSPSALESQILGKHRIRTPGSAIWNPRSALNPESAELIKSRFNLRSAGSLDFTQRNQSGILIPKPDTFRITLHGTTKIFNFFYNFNRIKSSVCAAFLISI